VDNSDQLIDFAGPYSAACDVLEHDFDCARVSDYDGICAWHDSGRAKQVLDLVEASSPALVSRAKPSLADLGVTAPEDHRLGGWKAIG
jgi:hypothetical protein